MTPVKSSVERAFQPEEKVQASITSKDLAILCLDLAGQFKASDIVLLGVSKLSSFADHFLICTGLSTRQVQGIADNLERALRDHGLRPLGIEGRTEGKWVLMDYGEIIIHIFYEPVRHFYDLESLWSEAERLNVNS